MYYRGNEKAGGILSIMAEALLGVKEKQAGYDVPRHRVRAEPCNNKQKPRIGKSVKKYIKTLHLSWVYFLLPLLNTEDTSRCCVLLCNGKTSVL